MILLVDADGEDIVGFPHDPMFPFGCWSSAILKEPSVHINQ